VLAICTPWIYGWIYSGHTPIRAELERMVVIEGLLMEAISIVIQYLLNPLYPVVKDKFQFKPLNFTQKVLNASEKIVWPRELLPWHCRFHIPEKPKPRRCQARTVRWMRYSNNRTFSDKILRDLWAVDATVAKV
jgi:hypothetical protein